MLEQVGRRLAADLGIVNPWGSAYAVARTLLAFATLTTLVATPADALFLPVAGHATYPNCGDVARWGLFCLAPGHLDSLRLIAIGILGVVVLGFWPRICGVLHWWIAFSYQANATVIDGGDQIAAIITMLLLPCTLTDPRWNHWAPMSARPTPGLHALLFARSSLIALRVQVATIYFHACVSKFRVAEWVDGTALYYWVSDPHFGPSGPLKTALEPIVRSPAVALLTWSALAIELSLAMGVVMRVPVRQRLLWVGVLFHVGIALVHGLVSFSLVMVGALFLYSGWHSTVTAPRLSGYAPAIRLEPVDELG